MALPVACHKKAGAAGQGGADAPSTTIDVQMQHSTGALALAVTAQATSVDLNCPNSAKVTLDVSKGPITVYRDASTCSVDLKEFGANAKTYKFDHAYLGNVGLGNVGVFYKKVSNSEVDASDQFLARRSMAINDGSVSDVCSRSDAGCNFKNATVTFTFSDIVSATATLTNKINISALQFNMKQEPAPECTVTGTFVDDASDPTVPPGIQLTLSGCKHNIISADTYQFGIDVLPVPPTIEAMQKIIDARYASSTVYGGEFRDNTITLQTLSYNDLKSLLHVANIVPVDVYNSTFVLSLRNKDGISVAYYTIQNSCAQNMFDFTFVTDNSGSWTYNMSSFQVYNWVGQLNGVTFDGTKTYEAYCIDNVERTIVVDARPYYGNVLSTYSFSAATKIFTDRSATQPYTERILRGVNYLLNVPHDDGSSLYTRGDIQMAIWDLIGYDGGSAFATNYSLD